MIIALYIVAFAMVGGGLAALVQGLPYIMVERGWAMVIAGTVAASGGAVLAGIAVIATRLGRIQDDLAAMQQRAGRLDLAAVPPRPPAPAPEPKPEEPEAGASPALPVGEHGARAAAVAAAAPLPPEGKAADEAAGGEPEAAPDRRQRADVHVGDVAPDVADAAKVRVAESRLEPRPTAAAAVPVREPAPPAEAPEAPAEETTVIGTYSSGGNSYVMYSDGSIQADTPSGVYRFKSLDELKEFIAAGGEAETAARR